MEPLTLVRYENRKPLLLRRSARLTVVEGPDRGRSCAIEERPAQVGSAPESDLVLTDPHVSRRHLSVARVESGFRVVDLGSRNGVFYRGGRVQELVVPPESELQVGSGLLRIELGEEQSEEIAGRAAFGELLGSSPEMQQVFGILAAVAPNDVTVLIEGETGTGKELVAEELHQQSQRRDGPFVVVDCGSMPAGLIESELFGHERGAFSGADRARAGAFEEAHRGTVFLDEIGELPLELQTRLLRVLDRREVRRVGGDRPRPVDLRVVAATNRELAKEVRAGRFRQDLYYRLAVARIVLPPLRKRKSDIPILARHFLVELGSADPDRVLTDEVVAALTSRRWPGNVRQLRNFIERVIVMTDGVPSPSQLSSQPGSLPAAAEPPPAAVAGELGWLTRAMPQGYLELPYKHAKDAIVAHFDQLYLGRLVAKHGSNIRRIAQEAGVDRVLVRRLLRRYGLLGGGSEE